MIGYPRGKIRIRLEYHWLIFVARTARHSLASLIMADPQAEILRQAVLQARAGQPKEALELLLRNPAQEAGPNASHYHLTVGALLLEQGRPGEAFAHLDVVMRREGPSKTVSELWTAARERA